MPAEVEGDVDGVTVDHPDDHRRHPPLGHQMVNLKIPLACQMIVNVPEVTLWVPPK